MIPARAHDHPRPLRAMARMVEALADGDFALTRRLSGHELQAGLK